MSEERYNARDIEELKVNQAIARTEFIYLKQAVDRIEKQYSESKGKNWDVAKAALSAGLSLITSILMAILLHKVMK